MKKSIVLAMFTLLLGCGSTSSSKKENNEKFFYNRKGVIVHMSIKNYLSNGEGYDLYSCPIARIRDVVDTTLFLDASTIQDHTRLIFPITWSWYSNHFPGDTVKFEHIAKSRYYSISPR